MNVLYVCPGEGCGARLFAAPGGTKLHCRHHPDTVYVQVEEYAGPDFKLVDPDRGLKGTGIATPGAINVETIDKQIRQEASEQEIKNYLRQRYLDLYGEKPDLRYGPKKLRMMVSVEEARLEAETKKEMDARKGILAENGEEE